MATQLERDKHARYLLHCLREVPQPYAALDTSRLSLAYFCVAGLDVLAHLGKIDAPLRAGIVEWIYSLQVLPPSDGCAGLPADRLGGFRGSGYLGAAHSSGGAPSSSPYDGAHLAMTYTALAVLLTLGDDLSRVDQPRVLAFVSSLQDEAGCFSAYPGGERDMRFLFCAAAVVAMLRGGAVRTESSGCEPFPDPSRTLLGPFLQVPCLRAAASTSSGRRGTSSSRAGSTAASGSDLGRRGREREGGRGRGREREEEGEGALLRRRGRDHASPPPPQESHGGSTFTGLAALALMGTLRRLPQPQRTVRWCVERQARSSRDRAEIGARSGRAAHLSQVGGFQGRPNKDEDTCYSFWIGTLNSLPLGQISAATSHSGHECGSRRLPRATRRGDPAAAGRAERILPLVPVCAPDVWRDRKAPGHAAGPAPHPLRPLRCPPRRPPRPRAPRASRLAGGACVGLSLAGAAGLAPLEPRLGITARAAARARGCEAEGECQTCEEETTVWDGSLREPG